MAADVEIRSILARAFPEGSVRRVDTLSGGISARAQVATVELAAGDTVRVVVRRLRRDSAESALRATRDEYRVLGWVTQHGILAPIPLHLDVEVPALVLEFVTGEPDFAPVDLDGSLREMAGHLARLHALPPHAELADLPRYAADLAETLQGPPQVLDEALNEARVRAVLRAHFPWPKHNFDVLLHGDYWPGNLLWQQGTLRAVLDWEQSCLGDPLIDVAIARLDVLWAFGERGMDAFTAHYAEQSAGELDWSTLPLWDLAIALRPMSNLTRWASVYAAPPIARSDVTEVSMRAGHQAFVERALRKLQER